MRNPLRRRIACDPNSLLRPLEGEGARTVPVGYLLRQVNQMKMLDSVFATRITMRLTNSPGCYRDEGMLMFMPPSFPIHFSQLLLAIASLLIASIKPLPMRPSISFCIGSKALRHAACSCSVNS